MDACCGQGIQLVKKQQTTCLHTAIQVSRRRSSSSATSTPCFELKYSLKPPSHDTWMAPHEQNGDMSCYFGGIGHNLHPMGGILSLCENLRTVTGITKQPPSRSRWGFNFGWNYSFKTPQRIADHHAAVSCQVFLLAPMEKKITQKYSPSVPPINMVWSTLSLTPRLLVGVGALSRSHTRACVWPAVCCSGSSKLNR